MRLYRMLCRELTSALCVVYIVDDEDETHKKNMWNTKSSEIGPKYQNVANTRQG